MTPGRQLQIALNASRSISFLSHSRLLVVFVIGNRRGGLWLAVAATRVATSGYFSEERFIVIKRSQNSLKMNIKKRIYVLNHASCNIEKLKNNIHLGDIQSRH